MFEIYIVYVRVFIYDSVFYFKHTLFYLLANIISEAYEKPMMRPLLNLNSQGWTLHRWSSWRLLFHTYFAICSRYQRGLSDLSHGAWSSLKDRPASERAQTEGGRARVMKSARIWNAPITGNTRGKERGNGGGGGGGGNEATCGIVLVCAPAAPIVRAGDFALLAGSAREDSCVCMRAGIESSSLCSGNCLAAARWVVLRSR